MGRENSRQNPAKLLNFVYVLKRNGFWGQKRQTKLIKQKDKKERRRTTGLKLFLPTSFWEQVKSHKPTTKAIQALSVHPVFEDEE